jgi:hypothetical protein
MKAYWGVGVQLHAFFDLGTRWRWVVSFTPRPLYSRERAPGTHFIGGWAGPKIYSTSLHNVFSAGRNPLPLKYPGIHHCHHKIPLRERFTDLVQWISLKPVLMLLSQLWLNCVGLRCKDGNNQTIKTRRIGVLGFGSRRGLGIFLFTTVVSKPVLGSTQPPIQRVRGAISLGVKRLGREADHSHLVPRSKN